MVKDSDGKDETPIAVLDEMRARYDGRDLDGGPAGLAVQVRDRIIRRLIDELKRERTMPNAEHDALERAITGALRSAIHDHGPITAATMGSAVKRVVGNLRNSGA